MRRRDVVVLCLVWGTLLGGLAWALSTQSRWVQENKPIQVQRPLKVEESDVTSPPETATGVLGTVSDDTMASMAKGLHAPTSGKADAKAGRKPRADASKSAKAAP
jgi:hypothetical protein